MNKNRIALVAVVVLAIGSGLVLSRERSTAQPTFAAQHEDIAAAGPREMTKPTGRSGSQQDTLIASAGPVALDASPARVILKASQTGESLGEKLGALAAGRQLYLIVGELSAARQPGVAFHVFFNLPSGAKTDLSSPQYAGTINFYDAVKLEGSETNAKDARAFSFDVTGIVRDLQSKKLLGGETTVTIRPGGVPVAGAQARIGRLDLVVE